MDSHEQEYYINLWHKDKKIYGSYLLKGRVGGGYMGVNLDGAVQGINEIVQDSGSREVVIKSVRMGSGFFDSLNLIEDSTLKGLVAKLNTNNLGLRYKLDSK